MRCEIERKDPEKDYMNKNPKRAAELAAYFTHAKLQVSIFLRTSDRPAAICILHACLTLAI